MSKLERLIQQYCPDGVEWIKIRDMAQVGTGSSNGNEADEDGKYPFFVRSQIVKHKNNFEYDEEAIIIPGEGGIGDIFHYIKGKYALHQRVYRIHFTSQQINVKFAFYYMKSAFKRFIMTKAVSATVTSIRKPMIEDFEIPVPPLPVQEEIVRILDTFTELQAELQAELQKRLQQYNYYRDNLLSFYGRNDVQWKKLGDVAYYVKNRVNDSLITISNYVSVENLLQNRQGKTNASSVPDGSLIHYESGDILIGNIRPYLKKIWLANGDGGTNGDVLTIRVNRELLTPEFLYQCLASDDFFQYDMNHAKGAKMPRGSKEDVLNYMIPITSLAEQQKIVSILDRFNSLTNDLAAGLPAEIEKRRQQYEYYRDKLLTFKRKEA